ncbi:marginal zone B- and B1-cell-specific protein [Numida meleagris]|uniref:marginal zone B- and B1-cell-specific protein n=1 Tax=Numida meleagris TaxID=8996 RepID=UPI000B3E1771|nr:marginal zone B- and B1-cell-specific protein [Numida meleagris]
MRAVLVLCVALSLAARTGAEDGCGGPEAPSLTHSIPAPQMSAEERLSPHMPEALRCDACHAIAFQLEGWLSHAEAKQGRKALSESDYMEVLEQSCSQDWELYGVQELRGERRLMGPGLPGQEAMSVAMMGGPWPGRLAKMCHSLVGELGEEQLYGAHRRGPTALRELLCHGEKGPCAHLGRSKAGGSAPPKVLQNEL